MQVCPQCGEELSSGDAGGLCPACLIAGAFDTSLNGSETAQLPGQASAGDQSFGRYQIVRVLGEGGMGTVYLAEQLEPIRRQVALKVVKLGMDTSEVLARFNNERQALAMMDHPNVARIFDAGATAQGRPYFVMEYIDGVSITEYCDRERLTTKQRLELFLPICSAVQHAHQKGVIHRDLKPSNVLITERDGMVTPKVIDFGIAKATDKRALENTLFTQFGQMVGTPEYASPEQADVVAGEIDSSSDVYSLGVLLYELLIGAVPFDPATLRKAGLVEMLRIIREEEPPSLARKLTTMGSAATDVAASRRTDAVSLRRLVDGDLNWITMKALEKSKGRRYASVSDLAADIQRHLEDRPVLAGPPGGLYRARKFIRRHRLAVSALAAGLVLSMLGGGVAWSVSHYLGSQAKPKLTDKDTILLAEFVNMTGDPVFDGTLLQGLSAQLAQSPFLSIIPERNVQRTLRLMGRTADARLTPDIAREVCERTGGAAVLDGSIRSLGSQYVLGLSARNCRTGDVLDEEQVQVGRKEEVLGALTQIASRFRTRVGESLATVEKYSTPLEATTPSLEALRVYSEARRVHATVGGATSMPLFKRAIEIDPRFAMAYALLGHAYAETGESDLSAAMTTKAWQLRDHATDAEKFFLEVSYNLRVLGNFEKVQRTCETWAQAYPRESNAHAFQASGLYVFNGNYEKAVEEASKSIELNPDFALAYDILAWHYENLDKLEEASKALDRASARKLETPDFYERRYEIAFLRGDKAGMDRVVASGHGKTGVEDMLAGHEAFVLAYSGRLQQARKMAQRSVDLARQPAQRERAALFQIPVALWESFFGNASAARQTVKAALELSKDREVEYGAAFALALAGDSAGAESLAKDLEKRFPEDSSVQFSYRPAILALIALNQDAPAKAMDALQAANPNELGTPRSRGHGYFGALYPIYVRGLAFLKARQGEAAAAEFRKILKHPGIVSIDPIGAVARLQLARALVMAGDQKKATAAYQDFLSLWKDADPDIPILQQAKAENARL